MFRYRIYSMAFSLSIGYMVLLALGANGIWGAVIVALFLACLFIELKARRK